MMAKKSISFPVLLFLFFLLVTTVTTITLSTILSDSPLPPTAFADDHRISDYTTGDIIYEQTTTREILEVYPDGSHRGTLSIGEPPRMIDSYDRNQRPVYVDYNFFEDLDHIKFEAHELSYAFDKNTCELLVYDDGGHITSADPHTKTLSHAMQTSVGGTDTWTDTTSNLSECITTTSGTQITATKSDFNTSTQTGSSYDVIYDFQRGGTMEWTYQTTNNDITKPDDKFGFTFVCEGTGCSDIVVDGEPLKTGDSKEKSEIVGKELTINGRSLDLKEEQHGSTWSMSKPTANKLIVDFHNPQGRLALGDTLTIDPVINIEGATFKGCRTGSNNALCANHLTINSMLRDLTIVELCIEKKTIWNRCYRVTRQQCF